MRMSVAGRKDRGPHFVVGLWFPTGETLIYEGRKDRPALAPDAWCTAILKALDAQREAVRRYQRTLPPQPPTHAHTP